MKDTAGVPACEADAGFRLAGSCLKGLKKAGFIPGRCDVKCIHYRTQEQGIVDCRNAPGGNCFPNPERLWSGWLRIRENAGLQVRGMHGIGKNGEVLVAVGRPFGVQEAACLLRIRAMLVEAILSAWPDDRKKRGVLPKV